MMLELQAHVNLLSSFYKGSGDQTQVLMLARQALYQQIYLPIMCSWVFKNHLELGTDVYYTYNLESKVSHQRIYLQTSTNL